MSTRDARTGHLLRTVRVPSAERTPVDIRFALEPTTRHLFAAIDQLPVQASAMYLLDARTGTLLHQSALSFAPRRVAIDPATGLVFVVGPSSVDGDGSDIADSMAMIDARSGAVLLTANLDSPVHALVVDDQHGLILMASDDGRVLLVSARTGRLVGSIPVGDEPDALALDEQRGMLYVANKQGGGPPPPDRLSWVPDWARQRLRWLMPRPPAAMQTASGSVTIIDLARLLATHSDQG